MKKLITSLCLCLSVQVAADQVVIDKIEMASMRGDSEQLMRLQASAEGYDRALASYRMGVAYNVNRQTKKAKEQVDLAVEILKQLTKDKPEHAEAWALLSNVYGMQIGFNPMSGITYGPLAAQALENSLKINNLSPRVHLVHGIAKYNTPALFGGGKKTAIEKLDRAIQLYKLGDTSGYNWGYAESYVWRGLSHLELGNKEEAISDWEKALEIAPYYGWPQYLIKENS